MRKSRYEKRRGGGKSLFLLSFLPPSSLRPRGGEDIKSDECGLFPQMKERKKELVASG